MIGISLLKSVWVEFITLTVCGQVHFDQIDMFRQALATTKTHSMEFLVRIFPGKLIEQIQTCQTNCIETHVMNKFQSRTITA